MLGGIAVFLAMMIAVALFVTPLDSVRVYLLVGSLSVVVGLADDLLKLRPAPKLLAQVALATLFVSAGHQLRWIEWMSLDAILTVLWIVGVTNAFNFIDNMDGLCSGVAVLAGLSLLMMIAARPSAAPESAFLAAFIGATAAFLVYNRSPATIFLGDSGSMLIGMMIAGLTLELSRHGQASHAVAVVATPVLILLVPIFDTLFVTVKRVMTGRKASQGGRDHTSHRLVAMGLTEKTAVLLLWMLGALGAVGGLGLRHLHLEWAIVIVLATALSMIGFGLLLGRVRV